MTKASAKAREGPVSSLSDDVRPSVVNQAASATGGSTNLLRKRPELSYLANAEIKVVGAQQDLAWRARNAGALQRAKAAEGTAKNLASPRRPRSLIRAAILNGVPTKRPPVASSTSVSRSYGDVESRAISSRGWSAFFPTQRSSDRFSRMETPAVEEGHHEMALEEHPKYGVVWLRGLGRYKLRTAYDAARGASSWMSWRPRRVHRIIGKTSGTTNRRMQSWRRTRTLRTMTFQLDSRSAWNRTTASKSPLELPSIRTRLKVGPSLYLRAPALMMPVLIHQHRLPRIQG